IHRETVWALELPPRDPDESGFVLAQLIISGAPGTPPAPVGACSRCQIALHAPTRWLWIQRPIVRGLILEATGPQGKTDCRKEEIVQSLPFGEHRARSSSLLGASDDVLARNRACKTARNAPTMPAVTRDPVAAALADHFAGNTNQAMLRCPRFWSSITVRMATSRRWRRPSPKAPAPCRVPRSRSSAFPS